MAQTFRSSKIKRFIDRLEAKRELYKNEPIGSYGHGKLEMLNEIINDLRHEFDLKEENIINAPFGYRFANGKLVIDEKEAAVVRLIHDLTMRGANEEEIKIIFNEFGVPKRGQDWKRPLEEIREQIYQRADELIRERLEKENQEEDD